MLKGGRVSDLKNETCPACGITYKEFKTGFSFQDIKDMFWVNSDDCKEWKHKRRNTILGRWHEIKLGLWKGHVEQCLESIKNCCCF